MWKIIVKWAEGVFSFTPCGTLTFGNRGGGPGPIEKETIYTPTPAPAPTVSGTMAEYVKNYPELMELQMKYLPQQARLAKGIGEELYPTTTGLQEQLAGIAAERMEEPMPDWMRQQYLSDIRANLGTNIGAPIGAEYTSRQMLGAGEDWRRYYQNLGATMAGRQQLVQPPSYQAMSQGYDFPAVSGQQMTGYGAYVGAQRPFAYQPYEYQKSPWSWSGKQGLGYNV